METGEEEDVQGRSGDKHSRKIYGRCESAGVVFTEQLMIGVGGKSRRPLFQQEWEDLSLSQSGNALIYAVTILQIVHYVNQCQSKQTQIMNVTGW